MLLHDLILNRVAQHGTRPALLRADESVSYTELAARIETVADGLAALGLKAGDRIAVYLNKQFETVATCFGASLAGGVFVPVNPVLKAPQVAHILNDCDVTTLVTSAAFAKSLEAALRDCPALRHVVIVGDGSTELDLASTSLLHWTEFTNAPSGVRRHRRIDNDVVSILYTSGSTGKPKGVVLSQRNMVNGALSVASYLENSPDDRILAVLPFSFDAGFSQMTTGFSAGSTVVLMDYLLAGDVVKAAGRYEVTGITGVPPLWNQLARQDWPAPAVASLRYIANTGGAMPTATLATLRKKLPNTRPYLMYGLTEAFRSTYLPPEELDRRPTSIGKAIPDAEILVVRDDGTRCAPNEPGELVHRGALVALGYWNDPERTASRFRPVPSQLAELPIPEIAVWSGDTVVMDEDGYLYFVGRKDDMIKSSGYRISPTEVEEVIYATGLVTECAALGIPHPDIGQAVVIVAHSQTADDETREAILRACRSALPNFMVPSAILWQESLPRNPNGKIDRKALGAEFQDLFQDES